MSRRGYPLSSEDLKQSLSYCLLCDQKDRKMEWEVTIHWITARIGWGLMFPSVQKIKNQENHRVTCFPKTTVSESIPMITRRKINWVTAVANLELL